MDKILASQNGLSSMNLVAFRQKGRGKVLSEDLLEWLRTDTEDISLVTEIVRRHHGYSW